MPEINDEMERQSRFDSLKKRLKENLDFDHYGRLSAFASKAAALNEPVLIVGLGGTGVDAVLNVKRMIYDRLKCGVINGEWQDKPENIEYLCLDTDSINRHRTINGLGFTESRNEIFIFTHDKLATILKNKDSYLTEDARSWVNDYLHCDMVLNGAGAVRQVGRLMMFMNIDNIVGALETKIKNLTRRFNSKVPIKVFVLSGISGGTGSGTFIDIPYIIKGIAGKPEIGRTAEIIGVLFLPDVNAVIPGLTDTKKQSLKRNGFAALKELDYLMNLHENGEYFEQNYGSLHVKENTAPYYACILMSSKSKTGKASDQPYEYTINVAAETVVNFIAREDGVDPSSFSINSFLSNQFTDRAIFANRLGKNRKPVNYFYCVTGASSAYLPMDDLVSYMTYLAFQQIDTLWNRNTSSADVQAVIDRFELGEESMKMRLTGNLPKRTNIGRHKYEMFEQRSELIISEYDQALAEQKSYVDSRIEDLVVDFQKRVNADENIINEFFRDINRGPVYAQRVIYSTSENNPCVMDALRKSGNNFLINKPSARHLEVYQKSMSIALDKIREKKLIKNKGKLRDDFIKSADFFYDELIREYVFVAIANAYERFNEILRRKNNEVYEYIAGLMETLVMLFSKYGRIKTETKINRHATGETLSWYMIDTPTFIEEISRRMNRDKTISVDLKEFITRFYMKLFEKKDIWNGRVKADVVEVLNKFISEEFKNLLDKTMDYYMEFFAGKEGKSTADYCTDLISKMDEKATIMFSVNTAAEGLGVVFPGHTSISVPVNANAVKLYATQYGQGQVVGSAFLDRMFMLNYKTAVPLYFYDELPDCENAYETNYDIPGVHLYERNSENCKDWHDLPSPYPDSEWMTQHNMPRVSEESNKYRTIFEKGKQYGFINWHANKYYCRWGRPVDYTRILKEYNIDPDRDFNNPANVKNAYNEIKKQLEDIKRLEFERPVYDCLMLGDGVTPNDDYAKNIFIKMPETRQNIWEMVDNYEECLKIMEKIGTGTGMETDIRNYLRCLFTDVVYELRGGMFKYRDKNGVSYNLHTIEGKESIYPEFYLFNAFLKIDRNEREKLNKLSVSCYEASVNDIEKYEKMKIKVESFIDSAARCYESLKDNWQETPSGAVMLEMYRNILEEAEAYAKTVK